jgi:hypothetical protein
VNAMRDSDNQLDASATFGKNLAIATQEDEVVEAIKGIRSRDGTWFYCEYEPVLLKNGKPGKRIRFVHFHYTPINYCDVCGKFGRPKKVQERNGVWGWNIPKGDYSSKSKNMLCMGCWNVVRALKKRERESDELRKFINKLQRTISNERKQINQDNGRAS